MQDQYKTKKSAISAPADPVQRNERTGRESRIAYDAARAATKTKVENSRSDNSFTPEKIISRSNRPTRDACTRPSDTPVMPIAESHIAKQSGHVGSRIKPIIELLEVKPTRSGFRCFAQLIRNSHSLRLYCCADSRCEYSRASLLRNFIEVAHEICLCGQIDNHCPCVL
jgi:hypothetical protein